MIRQLRIALGEERKEMVEVRCVRLRVEEAEGLLPVRPAPDEVTVQGVAQDQLAGHGEQKSRLAAWPGGDPMVRKRSRVREAYVDHGHARSAV